MQTLRQQICRGKHKRHRHHNLVALNSEPAGWHLWLDVGSDSMRLFYSSFLSSFGMKWQPDGRLSVGKGHSIYMVIWWRLHCGRLWTRWTLDTTFQPSGTHRWAVVYLKNTQLWHLRDDFTNENQRISLSLMKTRIIHCARKMQASNSFEILEHNLFPHFLLIRIHEL